MSKEKTLIKNTAIVTVGKISTQFISFLLLPLYTSFLTTAEYGTVDLVNTLSNLIIPFLTLQLDQGIFRFLLDVRDDMKEKKEFISTTMIFLILMSLFGTALFLVGAHFINNEYKYFLLGYLLVNSFTNILLQITRGLGDNLKYTIGSFIFATVGIVLNVLFIAGMKMGAYGMLTATIIGHLVCILYIFKAKKIYKYLSPKYYKKSKLFKLLKYSFPLIPNAISWWIVNASDRLIISSMLGIEINGIYSVSNKFPTIITTIFGIFSITWTESAAVNFNEKDRDEFFNKVYNVTIRIFGSICLGMIALMPFAFKLLINKEYDAGYYQIPILIISTFFNVLVTFLGSIYVAKKLSKEIAKTSMFAAVINVVTHLAMIKFVGLYAASISTLIAWFSMFLYRYKDSKKYVNLKIDKKLATSLVILTTITTYVYYLRKYKLCAVLSVIVVIYAFIINKNNFSFIINMLKSKKKKTKKINDKNNEINSYYIENNEIQTDEIEEAKIQKIGIENDELQDIEIESERLQTNRSENRKGRHSKKQKKKKGGRIFKALVIILVTLLLVFMGIIAAAFIYVNTKINKVNVVEIDKDQLGITEETKQNLSGYRNIAILGIDSRADDYGKGNRSDCIIIASINNETKDVKLFSVYRDTYMQVEGYGLDKVTHAYSYGGAPLSLKTLNTNLGLNISDFVTVNFDAVAEAIDTIGGVEIQIESNEIGYVNQYIDKTAKITHKTSKHIQKAGMQNLDGVQAVAYSRVRYTAGGDEKRAERMRTVIEAMLTKLKNKSFIELNNFADNILPKIYTNISSQDILAMATDIMNYKITNSIGWPYQTEGITLDRWYGVPVTLESNVIKLHKEIFGEEEYVLPETIKNISDSIINKTGYK